MRFLLIVLSQLFLTTFIFSQRLDIPKENPDNGLDLKIVFQNYQVTTSYTNGGYTTEKGSFPIL